MKYIEMQINPVEYISDSNFLYSDPKTKNYFYNQIKESENPTLRFIYRYKIASD